MPSVKIGVAQYASVHLNLDASIQKLESIMRDASHQGVQLLVLGETWLSGYPAWLDHCPHVAQWNDEPMKEVYLKLHKSSLSLTGKEFEHVCNLCKKYKLVLCIGINERIDKGAGQGTLYNSVLVIDENGELQNQHRKLMPTYTEKMLYGMGDGAGLKSVETGFGKISASICWEHWMPLTRQALHNSGEHIHIALWPTVHELHQIASRHYAFEGRCFVVAAGQLLQAKDFPKELELPTYLENNTEQWVLRGGSCVIDPRGNFLVEPIFDKEHLIVLDIDTDEVIKERMTLDTSGHYQRNDVFTFKVDNARS
ncbi:MAG: carbon-nitrogen hydrolase family protein [Cyclobacteriaceae bacterium]